MDKTSVKLIFYTICTISLIMLSCSNPTTPENPTITIHITSPQNNSVVSELALIICTCDNIDRIKYIELLIDSTLSGLTDDSEPYSIEWNTTKYEDKEYTISVRAFDKDGNTYDSESINLIVDNTLSKPLPVNIILIEYRNNEYAITWEKSQDADFKTYKVEKSMYFDMLNATTIFTSSNIADTTFITKDIDPQNDRYFQMTVMDTLGYETKGQIYQLPIAPKVYGFIKGNGKILPQKYISDADLSLFSHDLLIMQTTSDSRGYFQFDNVKAESYNMLINKKYPLDNIAYKNIRLDITPATGDLGIVYLDSTEYDCYPLDIGLSWEYIGYDHYHTNLTSYSENFRVTITIEDTSSNLDTLFYLAKYEKVTSYRHWIHDGHPDSINTDIVTDEWRGRTSVYNGYIRSQYLTGFHLFSSTEDFKLYSDYLPEYGTLDFDIERTNFSLLNGKSYDAIFMRALTSYGDQEKKDAFAPGIGPIYKRSQFFSVHSGSSFEMYLDKFTKQ